MQKLTIIAILVAISIVIAFAPSFSKSVIAIQSSDSNYNVRASIGILASNISIPDYEARIFSDIHSANLTSPFIQAGRLSIIQYNLPPLQPTLNLPENNTYTKENGIELSWFNVTDPNQIIDSEKLFYILEIYNDTALTQLYHFNSTIWETSNTTAAYLTVPEDNVSLYWKITATDLKLNSTSSELRNLIIDRLAPTTFNLTSPANGTATTDNTPSLTWTPTTETNFDNYTIEFSTSPTYNNPNYTQKSTINSFSNWTTELSANTYHWKVIAYDKANNYNESNQFKITINAVTETITETISTGEAVTKSGGVKQKPFNLDIIAPPSVTVYSNDQVIVPLIVTNPANEIILKGIHLNVTSDSKDVDPFLAETYIPFLRPKEQRTIPLRITTHTAPGAYGITITANVVNPRFTDSVKIYANLIEKDVTSETRSSKQIIFARELFKGNPICLELNEYLKQAELALEKKQYDKALSLANNAIQSCKDLMAFREEPEAKTVESYIKKVKLFRTTLILIIESFSFVIILLIIFKLLKKKK